MIAQEARELSTHKQLEPLDYTLDFVMRRILVSAANYQQSVVVNIPNSHVPHILKDIVEYGFEVENSVQQGSYKISW